MGRVGVIATPTLEKGSVENNSLAPARLGRGLGGGRNASCCVHLAASWHPDLPLNFGGFLGSLSRFMAHNT